MHSDQCSVVTQSYEYFYEIRQYVLLIGTTADDDVPPCRSQEAVHRPEESRSGPAETLERMPCEEAQQSGEHFLKGQPPHWEKACCCTVPVGGVVI